MWALWIPAACSGTAQDTRPLDEWLGEAAVAAVNSIEERGPPRHHKAIYDLTLEEQEKKFCSPFLTRSEVDARFGRGQWRPLERFLIVQPDGKRRMIDNARKTLHNEFTTMFETIFTVSVDFIPAVIKQLARRMGASCPQAWGEQCPWLHFRLGTDDLPDAYRGLPVLDEHLPFSVVAIWVPHRGWRYTVLWGLAFGLESAVVAFNRFPQLGVAAARRCTYALAAAYFDDELSVETVLDANISQRGLFLLFTAMGAPPQPPKSFSPAPDRHYLGASVHLGDVLDSGAVRIQPKFATTAKVLTKLDSILTEAVFPRDLAGKLRGDLTWMFTMVSGHMGRLAQPVITKYQHAADESLQDCDRLTLQLLALVVRDHSPRTVTVCGPERRPLVIYSDASFEKGSLRLGWVVMDPDQSFSPVGGTCVVPPEVLNSWVPRRQQILPGETLCGLLLPVLHPDLLRLRDLLWFVDNEAATSALIRGARSQEDVHEIAQYAQYLLHTLQARAWIEWIDSGSNPSDGLSRHGVCDLWSTQQGWTIASYDFPQGLSRGALDQTLARAHNA